LFLFVFHYLHSIIVRRYCQVFFGKIFRKTV
jgi:hypothetical protein